VRLRSDAAAADAREMALEDLCAALGARLDDCWDRLDDAATQLHALHGVSFEAILDHLHNLTRCEQAREQRERPLTARVDAVHDEWTETRGPPLTPAARGGKALDIKRLAASGVSRKRPPDQR